MYHTNIPPNPKLGDTVHSSLLGHKSRHTMIYQLCPQCDGKRWVCNTKTERVRICQSCYAKNNIGVPQPYQQVKTIGISDLPQEGDVIRANAINKKGSFYQWVICPDCKKGRWVPKAVVKIYVRCSDCANKYRRGKHLGEESNNWKGGRITSNGYVLVVIRKDNSYYRMVNGFGYVLEHRLIMAQHLGRCIEKWEIIHHKNRIKNDNRIENLELIESKNAHNIITGMQKEIQKLNTRVEQLEIEAKLSKWHIKELESSTNYQKWS